MTKSSFQQFPVSRPGKRSDTAKAFTKSHHVMFKYSRFYSFIKFIMTKIGQRFKFT